MQKLGAVFLFVFFSLVSSIGLAQADHEDYAFFRLDAFYGITMIAEDGEECAKFTFTVDKLMTHQQIEWTGQCQGDSFGNVREATFKHNQTGKEVDGRSTNRIEVKKTSRGHYVREVITHYYIKTTYEKSDKHGCEEDDRHANGNRCLGYTELALEPASLQLPDEQVASQGAITSFDVSNQRQNGNKCEPGKIRNLAGFCVKPLRLFR